MPMRAPINWGLAQTPPLFTKSPFSSVWRPAEQEGGDENLDEDWRWAGATRADRFDCSQEVDQPCFSDRLSPIVPGRCEKWLAALDDFRNWLIREAA
jgi:hypothetical protein